MNGPVVLAVPPAPGSAEPANLYVDLQSRALWLGVDQTVDPDGAVLISDIVALEAGIIAAEVNSKAYTDEQIVTRAPVVHTHTASQIIDFDAAVDAAVGVNPSVGFAVGMIVLWSGVISSIGVGALAGWHLCDGTSGTPDLRDRFVIGAGNKTPGSVNPNTSFDTDSKGSHSHTVGNHALTLAQMPAHTHATNIAGRHYGGTYDAGGGEGLHSHTFDMWTRQDGGSSVANTFAEGGSNDNRANTVVGGGSHGHAVYVDLSGSPSSDSKGSGSTHTHTLTSDGAHTHTITQAKVRDVLPYYALAYIMKIA